MPSMPSYVDPVDDLDTWNLDERAPDLRPRRGLRPVLVIMALLLLFAGGVGAAMTVPMWWPTPASTVVNVVPRAAPWTPGVGPLVQGLPLEEPTPQRLRFSPDGRAVGWTLIDPEKAVRLAYVLEFESGGAADSFGEIRRVDDIPPWVERSGSVEYVASIQSDLVVLRDLAGNHAGFVDLPGSVGLVDARAPVVGERDGRVLLATIARRPTASSPGAAPAVPPWSLHIMDVTGIVRPDTLVQEPAPRSGPPAAVVDPAPREAAP